MKKVCLLLPQLLLEMIHAIMEGNVVLDLHARFLSRSRIFYLRLRNPGNNPTRSSPLSNATPVVGEKVAF